MKMVMKMKKTVRKEDEESWKYFGGGARLDTVDKHDLMVVLKKSNGLNKTK